MYESIIEIFSKFIKLTADDIVAVKTFFKFQKVKKNHVLVNQFEYNSKIYFVNSGYLRHYKQVGDIQTTIHLYSKNSFVASLESYLNKVKSNDTIHCITDAELLYIDRDDLEGLFDSNIKWQRFGRKLMENFLLEKEEKIIELFCLSAEERYLKLMQTNQELIQNVPIQYLASYIGVQPESLSRIRKKILS